MRTAVILSPLDSGATKMSVAGKFGGGYTRILASTLTAHDLAALCAEAMLRYSAANSEGGDLVAPPGVLALVPVALGGTAHPITQPPNL